ncbi:hypothetical protein ScPMuIL_006183 [Solemya velum]
MVKDGESHAALLVATSTQLYPKGWMFTCGISFETRQSGVEAQGDVIPRIYLRVPDGKFVFLANKFSIEMERIQDTPVGKFTRSGPEEEPKDTNDVIGGQTGELFGSKEVDREGENRTGDEESDDAETIEYGHSESEVDDIFPETTDSTPHLSEMEDEQTDGETESIVSSGDEHIIADVSQSFDYRENAYPQFMKIYSGICTRAKERRHYTDEDLDDDEIEGKRNYNLEDRIKSNKCNKDFVKELKGHEFTLKYLQEHGLEVPILFHDKTGLGMRVPSENFRVGDVKQCVGSRRMLDVMDVNTQKGMEIHTRLENYVESPTLVRQLDWVDTVWPPHFKECQTESTNIIEKMMYPKVQKYCLMSVAGCYTDFHIDFGGTSVWYHILHGEKIFWLIPPTEKNIVAYENWILSAEQGNIFLGDQIKECQKIVLKAGSTFIIPSGWIHAVYTPKDSLVFGGNFIHSFNIVQQLRVTEVEDKTHVPHKFRYPFYNEICWYVLARYLNCLTGKNYLEKPVYEDEELSPLSSKLSKVVTVELTRVDDESGSEQRQSRKSSTESCASESPKIEKKRSPRESSKKPKKHTHLTAYELTGLEKLVEYLEELPENKKGIPKDMKSLRDPQKVLADMKQLLEDHVEDDPAKAVTGEPLLEWPPSAKKVKPKVKSFGQMSYTAGGSKSSKASHKGSSCSSIRRRRTRCKKCEPCTRSDCGECHFCKDMKKFGGPGRMKQCCISKQCMAPVLPNTAICILCGKDDRIMAEDSDELISTLMECGICWEIVHPNCLSKKYDNLDNEGAVNEDLPNQWECPKCCNSGKQGQIKTKSPKSSVEGPDVPKSESSKVSRSRRILQASSPKTEPDNSAETMKKEILENNNEEPVVGLTNGNEAEDLHSLTESDRKRPRREVQNLRMRGSHQRGRAQASSSRNKHRRAPSKYHKQIRDSSPTASSPSRRSQSKAGPLSSKRYPSTTRFSAGQMAQTSGKNTHMSPERKDKSGFSGAISGTAASMQEYLKQLDGRRCHVVLERHLVRPAPINAPPEAFMLRNDKQHPLKHKFWMLIFSFLSQDDLSHCLCVCKVWNRWCIHSSLWKVIDLSVTTIKKQHLCAIVRRQPAVLVLSSVVMTQKQLGWLVTRLPQLRELNLSHMSWATISALCVSCPLLHSLDLSWATELNEQCFKDLVLPPVSRTPGMDNKSRLSMLKCLSISGTEINDSNMNDLIQHVPKLENLTLSFCVRLTDCAIENLTKSDSVKNHLKFLNISGCKQLTGTCLHYLISCISLVTLNIERCPKITTECRRDFSLPSLKYFHW